MQCKECAQSECPHGKIKVHCNDCGASKLCPCGEKMKVKDGKCSSCLKCKSEGCQGVTSETFNYDLCFVCGCYAEGRTPAAKRQDIVFDFIRNNYHESTFQIRFDRTLPDQNCSRARPDILFKLLHRN